MYWEDRAGDSGPAGSAMSACVKYLEVMLPVDDLNGASRAIAANSGWAGKPGVEGGRMVLGQSAAKSTNAKLSRKL